MNPTLHPPSAAPRRAVIRAPSGVELPLYALAASTVLLALHVGRGAAAEHAFSWLWLLLGAPIVEEIVFRSGLHRSLLDRAGGGAPPAILWCANTTVALVFAAAHVGVQPGPMAAATFFPALAIGALYQRQRRLVPCIALHAALNAIGVLSVHLVS